MREKRTRGKGTQEKRNRGISNPYVTLIIHLALSTKLGCIQNNFIFATFVTNNEINLCIAFLESFYVNFSYLNI